MFKKLSLMGLLVTAIVGTTAYGMDEDDPRDTAHRIRRIFGYNFPPDLFRVQEGHGYSDMLNRVIDKVIIEEHQNDLTRSDERIVNGRDFGFDMTDHELAEYAAVIDVRETLIRQAAINPMLEVRLVINKPELQARINAYKQ